MDFFAEPPTNVDGRAFTLHPDTYCLRLKRTNPSPVPTDTRDPRPPAANAASYYLIGRGY